MIDLTSYDYIAIFICIEHQNLSICLSVSEIITASNEPLGAMDVSKLVEIYAPLYPFTIISFQKKRQNGETRICFGSKDRFIENPLGRRE